MWVTYWQLSMPDLQTWRHSIQMWGLCPYFFSLVSFCCWAMPSSGCPCKSLLCGLHRALLQIILMQKNAQNQKTILQNVGPFMGLFHCTVWRLLNQALIENASEWMSEYGLTSPISTSQVISDSLSNQTLALVLTTKPEQPRN